MTRGPASREEFEGMGRNPEVKPHMAAAPALATFKPIPCEVVESIGSGGR